jgi:outer membrane immunogenic protein
MKRILLVAALLISTSGAYAADMPLKAPPVAPPPPTWTGFYIGINGGGGWGTVDSGAADIIATDIFFAPANRGAVEAGASRHFDTSGALAGGQIGFLYQTGPLVTGIEAAFDWADINGSTSFGPTPYPVTPGSTFAWNLSGKTDFLATFLGRVGVDMGNWYPYITGGAALAHLKYRANFIDTFYPTNNTFNFSRDALGWALGGGAEARFAQHWLIRAEYLHMDFAHVSGVGTIACAAGVGNCSAVANSVSFAFNAKFKEDIARVALSYKF